MKHLNFSQVLFVIVGLTILSSCKKGENDPSLPLKTRKGRITGEWKLTSGTITETETIGGSTGAVVTTFTSSTSTSTSSAGTGTDSYTESIIIERDGTYEKVVTQNGSEFKVRGNWYFSGKSEDIDLKKKEAIIFSETELVYLNGTKTYDGLHANRILLIDQLKNKKMTFKGVIKSAVLNESGIYAYDLNYEKQ